MITRFKLHKMSNVGSRKLRVKYFFSQFRSLPILPVTMACAELIFFDMSEFKGWDLGESTGSVVKNKKYQ